MVRLGKRINGDKNAAEENTDKSRPVKVTLSDIEGKQMLMKNLSKLKHAPEHSQLKKMSVTRDMTKSEREQNKLKVVEAKTLNDKDTSGERQMDSKRPPMGEKSGQGPNKSKQKVNRQNEKDVHRSVKF